MKYVFIVETILFWSRFCDVGNKDIVGMFLQSV